MGATNNKGTNYTAMETVGVRNYVHGSQWGEGVCAQVETCLSAAQIDAGSTWKVARLPKGSIPLGIIVVTAGLGAAVTFKIGDGTTTDKFVATGGITDLTSASQQIKAFAAAGFGVTGKLSADTDIVITTEAQNYATAKTFETVVLYLPPV